MKPSAKELVRQATGNLHIDHDLALAFLVVFSRFEFALKECLFVHQGAPNSDLKLNYSLFAQQIGTEFTAQLTKDDALREAVAYYTSKPPRKQIWDGSRPDWSAQEHNVAPSSEVIVPLLYRVRNNLFHGGKGWLPPEGHAERDRLLVMHGITLVGGLLASHEPLRHAFSSYQ